MEHEIKRKKHIAFVRIIAIDCFNLFILSLWSFFMWGFHPLQTPSAVVAMDGNSNGKGSSNNNKIIIDRLCFPAYVHV